MTTRNLVQLFHPSVHTWEYQFHPTHKGEFPVFLPTQHYHVTGLGLKAQLWAHFYNEVSTTVWCKGLVERIDKVRYNQKQNTSVFAPADIFASLAVLVEPQNQSSRFKVENAATHLRQGRSLARGATIRSGPAST